MARARRPADPSQLGLFAPPSPLGPVYARAAELAAKLPPGVRFGTSSWSYPGWTGIVFAHPRTESELAHDGLREYAAHPLLRSVCIDRGYYAPIPERDLARYDAQLPPGFVCCLKAPASVTSAIVPGSDRAGAPTANPDFLSPARFMRDMGDGLVRTFAHRVGALIFELPAVPRTHRPTTEVFCERLDALFRALPPGLRCSVELRDPALLTTAYRSVLAAHGAAHVTSYHATMPWPAAQAAVVPLENAGVAVLRVVTPPGSRYDERKRTLAPFDRVQAPDPRMRAEVIALTLRAATLGIPVFVLVNNKAEGCSPETVAALAEGVAEGFSQGACGSR